jgi:hypothetical protein
MSAFFLILTEIYGICRQVLLKAPISSFIKIRWEGLECGHITERCDETNRCSSTAFTCKHARKLGSPSYFYPTNMRNDFHFEKWKGKRNKLFVTGLLAITTRRIVEMLFPIGVLRYFCSPRHTGCFRGSGILLSSEFKQTSKGELTWTWLEIHGALRS